MSDNLHRPYTESELDIMRDFCSREWTTDEDVRDNLHDSRWLATLAAKDAELERVRGAVRDYLDKRAVPCLPWQELKRARNAMSSAAGWTPPPDAADAGEAGR